MDPVVMTTPTAFGDAPAQGDAGVRVPVEVTEYRQVDLEVVG
jgi:hypothetical protein